MPRETTPQEVTCLFQQSNSQTQFLDASAQKSLGGKIIGRGERIRTSDLCVPNAALYQAEPRPDHRPLDIAAANRAPNTSHPLGIGQGQSLSLFACPPQHGEASRAPRQVHVDR